MKLSCLVQSSAIELLEQVRDDFAALIYIDPPWNVETHQESSKTDLAKLHLFTALHSKQILSSRGVLVWHTPPEWIGHVRNILDSIFTPDRFVSEIILRFRQSVPHSHAPRPNHSSLLIYSKTDDFSYVAPTGETDHRRFNKSDDTGRLYALVDITTQFYQPTLSFEWRGHSPPPNRAWRFSMEKLEELYSQGLIETHELRTPRMKRYLDDAAAPEIGSVWDDTTFSLTERNSAKKYPGQQPLIILERLISAYTNEDEIVIDPFSGTGTTLVAAHKLKRRWLGGDSSDEAIRVTLKRLKEIDPDLIPGTSLRSQFFNRIATRKVADLLKNYRFQPNILSSDIHVLVSSAESGVLEFKQTLSLCLREQEKKPYIEIAVLKTIGAFLNTKGGTLLVGVSDKNEVIGISAEVDKIFKGSQDKFLLHFQDLLRRDIGAEFYPFIEQLIENVDSTPIFRIDVLPAPCPCFVGKEEKFYVRQNPATEELAGSNMVKFIQQHFSESNTGQGAALDGDSVALHPRQ